MIRISVVKVRNDERLNTFHVHFLCTAVS